MTHPKCDGCGTRSATIERVQVSSGRDYPGVGGGISPPEYARLCEDCREARQPDSPER